MIDLQTRIAAFKRVILRRAYLVALKDQSRESTIFEPWNDWTVSLISLLMAPLDPTVARVLDTHPLSSNEDIDEDALLDSLDDDSTLNAFREQRRQQLHSEFTRAKNLRNQEHGTYTEIKDEKALMEITTSTKWCVVHFFKPDFGRCGIMDGKIEVR